MTVVSTLSTSDPKTPVNRDILTALFTPLGKCRFLEEKVCIFRLFFCSALVSALRSRDRSNYPLSYLAL